MSPSIRHLRNGTIFLIAVCFVAVVGYLIAGWSLLDAVYMAVITVFTVGYGETIPITSPELRVFTILFILFGCTGYLYIGGALVQFLIEGQIETALGNRRMTKSIQHLKNHTIICGYGRVGRMLAEELAESKKDFVIIDRNETLASKVRDLGYLCLQAEATSEESLMAAGIDRASEIAIVLPDDAANVFITLSARNLNQSVRIIARGMAPTTEGKLKQAGANQVVLPEHIGAERIASLILRPALSSLESDGILITQITNDLSDLGLHVEEFSIPKGSKLVGMTLETLETKGSSAFLIVTVVRKDGTAIREPGLTTRLEEGDTLITLSHKGDAPEFAKAYEVKREIHYRGASS